MSQSGDRKALIQEYKRTPRPMGVYRVYNRERERSLIGASINLPAMLNRHRAQLRMGNHPDAELQRDWNALGSEAFDFEVLDTLPPSEDPEYDPGADLQVLLELWIEKLAPEGDPGYRTPRQRAL